MIGTKDLVPVADTDRYYMFLLVKRVTYVEHVIGDTPYYTPASPIMSRAISDAPVQCRHLCSHYIGDVVHWPCLQ